MDAHADQPMHHETRRFITDRLLTAQELADLLGVPLNTIQTRARRGNIEGVKKGQGKSGFWLFDRKDFEQGRRRPGTKHHASESR